MSKPMTPNQFRSQLRKWGVSFREPFGDWETHNRGNRGNGWSNLNGFMWHHTGSDSQSIEGFLYRGTSSLPGPLCQIGLASNGVVDMIGWGRANHAGLGDDDVLRKVIAEEYSGNLRPNERNTDGNGRFYGMEIYYSGYHGMSHAQYNTALKVSAAICDWHGWSAKSCIGHGEWSITKWDPGYKSGTIMDMNAVRNDIQDVLDAGPNGDSGGSKEVSSESKTQAYKDVLENDVVPAPSWWPTSDVNKKWNAISYIRNTFNMVKEIRDTVIEIRDIVRERK